MKRLGVLLLALSTSGCALLASANAHHNSGGTACIESPAPATIDLVLGSAMLALMATRDAHPGAYALPGVFLASGVIGGVSAARCSNASEAKLGSNIVLTNSAPSFGNAEVDPEAVPATPEDMGVAPIPTETIQPSAPSPSLTLDPNYSIGPGTPHTPAPPIDEPKQPDKRIACGNAPGSCPKGQTCALGANAGSDAGYCVRDH